MRWKGWGTFSFWQGGREGGRQGEGKGVTARVSASECSKRVRPKGAGLAGVWLRRGQSTNSEVLRIDSSLQQRRLPAVQLLLGTTGQLQAFVVLVHVPANERNNVSLLQKATLPLMNPSSQNTAKKKTKTNI